MATDYLELIKEGFDPKLITALYRNFSDQYVALQELIDNAVDDRIEWRILVISIDYDNENNKLLLQNAGGKGMNIEDLKNFFQWGVSEKKTGKIGRYGQGGKAALGYLAKSFVIKSHPIDGGDAYSIKVLDWENRDGGFKEFQPEKFGSLREKGESSVHFEVYNLKKAFSIKRIRDRIAETYRPLILDKKVRFLVNGEVVSCVEANYDEGTRKQFEREVEVDQNKYKIYGHYGIVSDSKSERGGFRVYQFGRCVAQKEYFGHIDPSKRWNVERLYGELNIDFDLPLLMNKTDIDKDSDLWQTIYRNMHDELDSVVRQVIDYRAPSTKETASLERIKKKIKKKKDANGVNIDLTNYGPRLLFKIDEDDEGQPVLKINREHKAYIKWSNTEYGKKLYSVLMYSLYESTSKMSKKEATQFMKDFSENLINNSDKLI